MLRETGEVVGGCGLVRRELPEGVEIELGYHLRSDLWGRGLATEAARACLDEARERGLDRVIAFIAAGERPLRAAWRAGSACTPSTSATGSVTPTCSGPRTCVLRWTLP